MGTLPDMPQATFPPRIGRPPSHRRLPQWHQGWDEETQDRDEPDTEETQWSLKHRTQTIHPDEEVMKKNPHLKGRDRQDRHGRRCHGEGEGVARLVWVVSLILNGGARGGSEADVTTTSPPFLDGSHMGGRPGRSGSVQQWGYIPFPRRHPASRGAMPTRERGGRHHATLFPFFSLFQRSRKGQLSQRRGNARRPTSFAVPASLIKAHHPTPTHL